MCVCVCVCVCVCRWVGGCGWVWDGGWMWVGGAAAVHVHACFVCVAVCVLLILHVMHNDET